jgi:hypothetical protein
MVHPLILSSCRPDDHRPLHARVDTQARLSDVTGRPDGDVTMPP